MLQWFLKHSYRYRSYLIFGLMMIPVVQFFRIIRPTIIKWVLEAVEKGPDPENLAMALDYVLLFMACIVINFLLQGLQVLATSYAGLNIVKNIREELFDHIVRLPFTFFQSKDSGQIIVRLTSDVEAVRAALSGGLIRVVGDCLAIVGILSILLHMNWRLTLYVIVAIPILLKVTAWIGRLIREGMTSAKRLLSQMTTAVSEAIGGLEVIHGFSKQQNVLADFNKLSRRYTEKYHELNNVEPTFYGFVEFVGSFLLACIIFDGTSQMHSQTLSFAELVAVVTYIQSIMHPIRHLTGMFNNLQNAWTSMQRIFNIMGESQEREVNKEPALSVYEVSRLNPALEFRDVEFSYGEESVLKSLNFSIKPGEKIAIVGRTGAGKSTIIKLLNRFYSPCSGEILLDGQSLERIPVTSLRERIGFVLQDVYLFSGSVQQNLSLFEERFDAAAAEQVRILQDSGFLTLPGQKLKDVEHNGENFSLGEKQLVAFGRVYAKNADVFLLDEATSNVDVRTEQFLQNQLNLFLKNKTAIIIAHRLSTVRHVDRILVLKDGEVVEQGNYAELVSKRGEFFEYFRHQYKDLAI